ncbi:J domain-containing protein [Azospirillum rugosum]|uniref:J domain-containing protein n=1 Tax=Azospirillum rugosum TaxID=416170 RepID=A0ABS4SSE2_9PROT|nr:J domain-containing protein [Azospirillum rugosum]MBP2295484.1 hypothetical protein [Azospirillum rugosum]MDQ0528363.1 hypothetical protein [Azospirillum rugosum]
MATARLIRNLLRLVFRRSATLAGDAWTGRSWRREGSYGSADAAAMAARCRRELAAARAERQSRVADLLRYGEAREVLVAREAAAPPGAEKEALRRSLSRLDDTLTAWFEELDRLEARIAALDSDLAFYAALAGEEMGASPGGASGNAGGASGGTGREQARPASDPDLARHLAALGLSAMPANLPELKAAYRARLKAVHPDLGPQTDPRAATEATAAATVAFAELRKHFVRA